MSANILIVDDDKEIIEEVTTYLKPHGFQVIAAYDSMGMWQQLYSNTSTNPENPLSKPKYQYIKLKGDLPYGTVTTKNKITNSLDLIILDIMLPDSDGISLCQQIRQQSSIPIIILSAAGSEADRVASLEIGADDFLSKPFSARELLARIKALLRRTQGQIAKEREILAETLSTVYFDRWCLDRTRRAVIDNNQITVPLSQREYIILTAFLQHPQRVLTRDQLLEYTRGIEASPFDRSIDVQIGRLRKKIERDPKNPKIILTVRGGGYQLNARIKSND